MNPREKTLLVGSLGTLGFLALIGVVKVRSNLSAVGGMPRATDTRSTRDRRGQGTTSYSGGTLGLGVQLGIGLDDDDEAGINDGLPDHMKQRHRCRYPSRPGELLEALTWGGTAMFMPPIPRDERAWMFAPPSSADLSPDRTVVKGAKIRSRRGRG